MSLIVKPVQNTDEFNQCFAIRQKVFVEEQQVAPEEEYDEFEDTSKHFLAFLHNEPVGTARYRFIDKKIKLERFAVLKEFRNKGVGIALVKKLLEESLSQNPSKIYLHAQVQVIPFYEKFGFETVSELFEEAGIMHKVMEYK
jgi:predicted GNAT family N-acyltransferase